MPQTIEIKLSADELEGTEATISQWLIDLGDIVQEGDPIVELETDKVSMEICAPKTGVLKEIRVKAGEKVETDTVLATFSDEVQAENTVTTTEPEAVQAAIEETAIAIDSGEPKDSRHLLSPAVRRLLKEENIAIDNIRGTGKNGRINRNDVIAYMESNASAPTPAATGRDPLTSGAPKATRALVGTRIPHSNMRKSIAKHMVESLMEISPHVTSVFEMDMSNIIEHRKWHKKEYAEQNVNLTYTAYFLAAMVKAVQQAPEVNARFHEDALEVFSDINIGVGTALGNEGLVVPVVQQVQSMSLFEIARALTEQTAKARDGKLKPSDMKNGTITISNHGVSGSLFAAPIIINQPEVAIMGIGKLEKRVVVEEVNNEDRITIKPMCYVSLSIDHRALDAHQTAKFLTAFVDTIEHWGL